MTPITNNPALAATKTCLLCGRRSFYLGTFWPTDSRMWGAPERKRRFFCYGLCRRCHDHHDRNRKVEQRIRRALDKRNEDAFSDAIEGLDLSGLGDGPGEGSIMDDPAFRRTLNQNGDKNDEHD